MTKKQKSMGEVASDSYYLGLYDSWRYLSVQGKRAWEKVARAVIREHEKRKKQKVVKNGKK